MPTWIIEPRDPLIVRDGKPFDFSPGSRAISLDFPFPSTTTGGVRTRAGLDKNGVFDTRKIAEVKQIAVRGPLLVELDQKSNEIAKWLIPAPADALLLEPDMPSPCLLRKRLVPITLPNNEPIMTNLPDEPDEKLCLVGQVEHRAAKPSKQAPKFWYWEQFVHWLKMTEYDDTVTVNTLGHSGPTQESRVHVKINANTQTAEPAKLFQTRGLEFTHTSVSEEEDTGPLPSATRLALAVASENNNIRAGLAALGGERRMVYWRESSKIFPACPGDLVAQIQYFGACRIILLTPASFHEQGWKPEWLLAERKGVEPELKAVAIQRPQVVSGWDFETRKPKPTRRLAPAGSVFFLKLEGTKEAVGQWVETMWMQCVSDDDISRRDGFGLAVVGVWDGKPQPMQMKGDE